MNRTSRWLGVGAAVCIVLCASVLAFIPFIQVAHAESVGTWTATTPWENTGLIGITSESCATDGGYVYCVGGFRVGGPLSGVYSAPLSSSGVGTWASTTSYPMGISSESCVVSSGYIYCVGGSDSGGFTADVYSATVSGGVVGAWQLQSTNPYPFPIAEESCAVSGGYIYCVGGTADYSYPNTGTNAVEIASISGGAVGSWQTGYYPDIMNSPSCAISGAYIYCVGGLTIPSMETIPVPVQLVYSAPLSGDLGSGTWTEQGLYPTSVAYTSCATDNGYLYCVGGDTDNSGDFTDAVHYASLSSGTVGTWQSATNYPQEIYSESCLITSGYIYCIGGNTFDSFIVSSVNYAGISGGSSSSTSSSTTSSSSSTTSSSSTSSSSTPSTPTPPPLPVIIPSNLTLNFNSPGLAPLQGKLVGLEGDAILYNVPGLTSGDVWPYVSSACSITGQNLIRLVGFGSAGPGNNSTEILVSDYYNILTNSQGWPSEPACG